MAKSALDEIDRRIITVLQRDGRMMMQDLAAHAGLSVSPCTRRMWVLEEGA